MAVLPPIPSAKREDDAGGKRPIAREHSEGVADILLERVEPTDAVDLVNVLAHASDVAELPDRRRPSVVWRHPAVDIARREQLPVQLQFIRRFVQETLPVGEQAKPRHERL
jgi:hypothetical protein